MKRNLEKNNSSHTINKYSIPKINQNGKTKKFDHEPKEADCFEMTEYIAIKKDFSLDLFDFIDIHIGFREIWNTHTGQLLGDGDIKNLIYEYLRNFYKTHPERKFIPQKIVDKTVDLMIDYMTSIGQYGLDFGVN